MGLLLGGRLRCVGMLRRGLGLVVLTGGVLAEDRKCECKERDGWFWECGSHGLNLPSLRFDASAEDSLSKTEKLAEAQVMRGESSMQDHYEYPARLKMQMHIDMHGIHHWIDSKQVPSPEILYRIGLIPEEMDRHAVARDVNLDAFAAKYIRQRNQRTPEEIAAERNQMRETYGTGPELVNIFTGEHYTT
jgi:hypothetical protein